MPRGRLDRRHRRALLQWGASLGLLTATAWWVGLEDALARVASADWRWIAAGVALSVPPLALAALRWTLIAGRVGLTLDFWTAWREYYTATWFNQILPGGIAGDVIRVVRHHRREVDGAGLESTAKAVVFERASSQLAVWLVVLSCAPAWFAHGVSSARWGLTMASILVVAVAARWVGRVGDRAAHPWLRRVAQWVGQADEVLLQGNAWWGHALLSLGIVASYVAVFWCSCRAVGVRLDVVETLRIGPMVLGATSIPFAFAGWGLREGAASGLFQLLGRAAADGAAASVVYGMIALVSALPGALFLFPRVSNRSASHP